MGKYKKLNCCGSRMQNKTTCKKFFSRDVYIKHPYIELCSSTETRGEKMFPHLRGRVLGDIISFPRMWYLLASCSSW